MSENHRQWAVIAIDPSDNTEVIRVFDDYQRALRYYYHCEYPNPVIYGIVPV
jgi:hypothetical protein